MKINTSRRSQRWTDETRKKIDVGRNGGTMRLYLEPTSHAAVLTIHTCFTLRPYIHKQATSGRPIIIQQIKWRGPMNYLLSQSSLACLNTIFVFLTVK